jgi:small subunit ribosomal protein S9
MNLEKKYKSIVISGKRKSAIAKAKIISGKGIITINSKNYNTLDLFDKLRIEEPLEIAKHILGELDFDVEVRVRGGGAKGQIEACRVALSKAILEFSKNERLKEAFLEYDRHLLVADVRRKEAYKPGDSKARAKRQTSYR